LIKNKSPFNNSKVTDNDILYRKIRFSAEIYLDYEKDKMKVVG